MIEEQKNNNPENKSKPEEELFKEMFTEKLNPNRFESQTLSQIQENQNKIKLLWEKVTDHIWH